MSSSGKFISIEGSDGTGKSTQVTLLARRLQGLGREVVVTREPGGTPGAERIRSLILEGEVDRWSAISEMLLFSAARRDHCERVILPALQRGAVVVSDRFHDSTAVYQLAAHGADTALFHWIHENAIGVTPHRTIVLLLDPAIARTRVNLRRGKRTRPEQRGAAFEFQVHVAYRELCRREPGRCKGVYATGEPEEIARKVWSAVREHLA